MRRQPSPQAERGRCVHPTMGDSPRGANYGFFRLLTTAHAEEHPAMLCKYELRVIVSDGADWDHVSVSRSDGVIPTWNDMCWIKSLFFDDEETVLQYHPAKSRYKNFHEGCLHLWRPQNAILPLPPIELV